MKTYGFNLQSIARRAMASYGFVPDFPPRVMKELHDLDIEEIFRENKQKVRDLRSLLWSSIDNIDSLDLDQLEYCEKKSNQEIHVMVAIADVDVMVPKASHIDRHAHYNGTSVYSGVKIFPMLPETLSHNATSLIQGEDRLAIVINYFVRKDGSVRFGEIERALVRNRAKLVYESLGAWLEEEGPMPEAVINIPGFKEQILLQDEAAKRLHEFRMEKGALELDTIEASPVYKDSQIVDLIVKKKYRSRYIIENFMIAANQTMVNFLKKKNSPYIERILKIPEKWDQIVLVAKNYNAYLPQEPDSQALSDFLARQRRKDPLHFPDLSLTIVKLIGAAEYGMIEPGKRNVGHFGLAVQDYTHSTAPNRRYVDVIIQRLLKAALADEYVPYTKRELEEISLWCTDRDQCAKKVERFMRKVAGTVLMQGKRGEVFEAIVTGSSEKGVYVRLLHPPVEGRVVRGEHGMLVGQKVYVRLIKLNPEKGFIDFERSRK